MGSSGHCAIEEPPLTLCPFPQGEGEKQYLNLYPSDFRLLLPTPYHQLKM